MSPADQAALYAQMRGQNPATDPSTAPMGAGPVPPPQYMAAQTFDSLVTPEERDAALAAMRR